MNVCRETDNQCQGLCSNKNPSLFKRCSPQDLISFSGSKCETKRKEEPPVLHECLQAATIPRETRKKWIQDKNNATLRQQITILVSVQDLLKRRCPQMCAQAYCFSIGVMWHIGAKKLILTRNYLPQYHAKSCNLFWDIQLIDPHR